MTAPRAAGWHGKLPSVGDFAGRRLPPAFIEAWDTPLAESLGALREREGHDWVDTYLASPAWRFVAGPGLLPGCADAAGWAGVLMPSVDRVGRYYPLTLAAPLTPGGEAAKSDAVWQWLGRLEDAAYATLHDDWMIEQLEDALLGLGDPPGADTALAVELAAGSSTWRCGGHDGPTRTLHARTLAEAFAAIWTASPALT